MRADRLVAALLVLQSRGRVTAAELAAELEVSAVTARRDLQALSTAGVPVYAQPGRGGGWSLIGGARTDLTGLTADEAKALFLLLGPAAATRPETATALRKLVQALPATFRASAHNAATSTVRDEHRWGTVATDPPDSVANLQAAIINRRMVAFSYAGANPGRRTVEPYGLVEKADHWYLVAGTPHGQRTFRLDRLTELDVRDETYSVPEDFDLTAAWNEISDWVEAKRGGLLATIIAPTRVVPILQHQIGRQFAVVRDLPDARTEAQVSAPTATMIAQHLAGWGAIVQVRGPASVRAELHRLGTELVQQNGPGVAPSEQA